MDQDVGNGWVEECKSGFKTTVDLPKVRQEIKWFKTAEVARSETEKTVFSRFGATVKWNDGKPPSKSAFRNGFKPRNTQKTRKVGAR